MVIRGVIEDDDHLLPAAPMPQQVSHENLEGFGVEFRAHLVHEATRTQIDGAEAGNGFPR